MHYIFVCLLGLLLAGLVYFKTMKDVKSFNGTFVLRHSGLLMEFVSYDPVSDKLVLSTEFGQFEMQGQRFKELVKEGKIIRVN